MEINGLVGAAVTNYYWLDGGELKLVCLGPGDVVFRMVIERGHIQSDDECLVIGKEEERGLPAKSDQG